MLQYRSNLGIGDHPEVVPCAFDGRIVASVLITSHLRIVSTVRSESDQLPIKRALQTAFVETPFKETGTGVQ